METVIIQSQIAMIDGFYRDNLKPTYEQPKPKQLYIMMPQKRRQCENAVIFVTVMFSHLCYIGQIRNEGEAVHLSSPDVCLEKDVDLAIAVLHPSGCWKFAEIAQHLLKFLQLLVSNLHLTHTTY